MREYGGNTLMWLDTNAAHVPCPDVVITALIARVRELEGILADVLIAVGNGDTRVPPRLSEAIDAALSEEAET